MTPARAALDRLIEAVNSPDAAPLEAFFAAEPALARFAPLWPGFRRAAAPVTLVRVEEPGPNDLTALIEDRWDRLFDTKLSIADGRLTRLTALPTWRPEDLMPERAAWPAVERDARARLARGSDSGALLVTRNGETLFSAAYGEADREAHIPNTLETRFRMGSMNKMLTGVATLQLAQAGALGIDDPVGKHLPGYPNKAFAETVTVRHLLNHTGGAGDFFGPVFAEHRLEMREPSDFIARLGHRDPEFEPGSQHRYANYGFIVLGRIIEAASGLPYDDYVAAHILAPAGMSTTGALPETTPVPGRAVGYMDSPAGPVSNDPTLPWRGTPAGGGYSTVGDLTRFAQALTSGALLDAAHMTFLGAGGVEVVPGVSYGAGFQESARGGLRAIGHSGGAPGMNGALRILPDTGHVIAALANADPPQADSLAEFIALRLAAA